MKLFTFFLLGLVGFLPLAGQTLAAEALDTVVVTSEGDGVSPGDANKQALRQALMTATGALVRDKILVLNGKVNEEMLVTSRGFIKSYTKLAEPAQNNGIWHVKLEVTVQKLAFAGWLARTGSAKLNETQFHANVNDQNRADAIKLLMELLPAARQRVLTASVIPGTRHVLIGFNYDDWSQNVAPQLAALLDTISGKGSDFDVASPTIYRQHHALLTGTNEPVRFVPATGSMGNQKFPARGANDQWYVALNIHASPSREKQTIRVYVFDKGVKTEIAAAIQPVKLLVVAVDKQHNIVDEQVLPLETTLVNSKVPQREVVNMLGCRARAACNGEMISHNNSNYTLFISPEFGSVKSYSAHFLCDHIIVDYAPFRDPDKIDHYEFIFSEAN